MPRNYHFRPSRDDDDILLREKRHPAFNLPSLDYKDRSTDDLDIAFPPMTPRNEAILLAANDLNKFSPFPPFLSQIQDFIIQIRYHRSPKIVSIG